VWAHASSVDDPVGREAAELDLSALFDERLSKSEAVSQVVLRP
jgi:hypothetical protein